MNLYRNSCRVLCKRLNDPRARAIGALASVLILGCFFNQNGSFFHWGTHRDLLRQISVYGILSCGMTLVILGGGIDLAVGSVLGLSAVVFSLLSIHLKVSVGMAISATLGVGLAAGLASGLLVARFSMQPFIATLAMMVFGRGLAKALAGGQKISSAVADAHGTIEYVTLPRIFEILDHKVWGGNIAVVTLVFGACSLVTWLLVSRLRWGRYIIAVGGNEEAARLSGVPIARTKFLVYGLSGLFTAIAGVCQAVQEQQGDPEAGVSYELTAIAMVVIGGNSLMGGRGGMGLTLMGIMTIGYLDKILSMNAIGESSRLMLTGIIIVAAVLLQGQQSQNLRS